MAPTRRTFRVHRLPVRGGWGFAGKPQNWTALSPGRVAQSSPGFFQGGACPRPHPAFRIQDRDSIPGPGGMRWRESTQRTGLVHGAVRRGAVTGPPGPGCAVLGRPRAHQAADTPSPLRTGNQARTGAQDVRPHTQSLAIPASPRPAECAPDAGRRNSRWSAAPAAWK